MKSFTNRQQVEMELQLINQWKFHNPESGFLEFRTGTPGYIKELDRTHHERFLQYDKNI